MKLWDRDVVELKGGWGRKKEGRERERKEEGEQPFD